MRFVALASSAIRDCAFHCSSSASRCFSSAFRSVSMPAERRGVELDHQVAGN